MRVFYLFEHVGDEGDVVFGFGYSAARDYVRQLNFCKKYSLLPTWIGAGERSVAL